MHATWLRGQPVFAEGYFAPTCSGREQRLRSTWSQPRPPALSSRHIVAARSISTQVTTAGNPATPGFLDRWHALPTPEAAAAVLPCCGSHAWADALAAGRPFADPAALLAHAAAVWRGLTRADWQQAFDSHPRLGETHATSATAASLAWSAQEQAQATPSDALRKANARYEESFGRIFILCANGRTAPEILAALERRLHNDPETEWHEAGEQQRQITQLRLERWVQGQA